MQFNWCLSLELLISLTFVSAAMLEPALLRSISLSKLFGRPMFIKRDDIAFISQVRLNGNKGRKFAYTVESMQSQKKLLSYGGFQSNSMLAIAKIANATASQFTYITKKYPITFSVEICEIEDLLVGNIAKSIAAGMQVVCYLIEFVMFCMMSLRMC